jgi:hypothetical protein
MPKYEEATAEDAVDTIVRIQKVLIDPPLTHQDMNRRIELIVGEFFVRRGRID